MSGTTGFVALGLFVVLIGAVFGIIGMGILVWATISRRKAAASQTWPTVPGQIVSSAVQRKEWESDDMTTYTYEPRVEYTYSVSGQSFTGRRLSFGSGSSDRAKKAEQIVAQYKPGTPITVYYDPAKPQDATLERRAAGSWIGITMGILFFVLGSCVGLVGLVLFMLDIFA